jgi:CHASE3 domain sensor protein
LSKLSQRRILILLIITPFLLLIELVIGYGVFLNIQAVNKAETKNNKLDNYLRTNTKYILNAESAQRGYLLTGDKKFSDNFTLNLDEIKKNEEYYDTLPGDIKSRNIADIQAICKRKLAEMALTISLYDAAKKDSALAVVKNGTGKRMMDTIRTSTTNIRKQITDLIAEQRQRETQLFFLFFTLITILIVLNLFMVGYTYRKFRAYTLELEGMVTSLQDANERMGMYTAMSYHELKTPLRNISGFAQLLKRKYSGSNENSEEHEFIKYITDGIKQLNQTINAMRTKYLDNIAPEKDID